MALISRTTPLTANQEWDSTVYQSSNMDALTGSIFADASCTLYIEQSQDNVNWDISSSYLIPVSDGKGVSEPILAPYLRVRLVNGTNAQSILRLFLNGRAPDGAYIWDAGGLVGPTEFFVVWVSGDGSFQAINGPNKPHQTFTASSPEDAIGQASLQSKLQGKFVAFNAATGVAATSVIETSASLSAATY